MLLARRPVEPDAAAIAACELEREVPNEVREAPKPQKPQPHNPNLAKIKAAGLAVRLILSQWDA